MFISVLYGYLVCSGGTECVVLDGVWCWMLCSDGSECVTYVSTLYLVLVLGV